MERDSKGRNTKQTKEKFIQSLPEKFKLKFDYSNTIYKGGDNDITFICPLHGKQTQKASKHKSSACGCSECAKVATQQFKIQQGCDRFVKGMSIKYENQYDFNPKLYKSGKTPLSFYCKKHNKDYQDTPQRSVVRHPCTVCRKEARSILFRKSEEAVRVQSFEKFNRHFEFDFTNYKNTKSTIGIKCPTHGWYKDRLTNHLASTEGCTKCFNEKPKRSWNLIPIEDNVKILENLYKGKYHFFTEDIKDSSSKVRYYCPKHHNLKTTAMRHLKNGFACNQCGDEVMAEKLTGFYTTRKLEKDKKFYKQDYNNIYLTDMTNGRFKIGIAKHVDTRHCGTRTNSGTPDAKVIFRKKSNTYDVFYLELFLHAYYKDFRYKYKKPWKGHTEVFNLSEDQISTIIKIMEYNL